MCEVISIIATLSIIFLRLGNFSSDVNLSYQMDKLEGLQYQARLAVTGMWQGKNRDKVYEELGWESLHLRRYFRRLTIFYKIMNGLTPQYLLDPVPPEKNTHLYGTSCTNNLHPMMCRAQRFKIYFYPNAVVCWNNIGPEIRNLSTLTFFRSKLIRIIFNIHNHDLKYLYQLRVELSAL